MDADEMLQRVAAKLGQLDRRLVYLGGAVTQHLITDPAAPKPTATTDVDVIVDITSRVEYLTTLREELRRLGAKEDTSEDAPLCRWIVDAVTTDIMPVAEGVLGFGNRWYSSAMASAVAAQVRGTEVLITDAPHFVATKIAAFNERGRWGLPRQQGCGRRDRHRRRTSRTGLRGRAGSGTSPPLRRASLVQWLESETFRYAVEGYLRDDDDRVRIVLARVAAIGQLR